MIQIKDNWEMPNDIPNKAEIPILNHRDDGENRNVKIRKDTIKFFSFRTLYELMIIHGFRSCDVAIAEDFFWTSMPFMSDGKLLFEDDVLKSCVVASSWGTPCVVVDDKAWACYEEAPDEVFPGVYLADWDPEFLERELDKAKLFMLEKIEEKLRKKKF